MLTTAARAAPVCIRPGKPRHMFATMFTILPPCANMQRCAAIWHIVQVPVRFVSITAFQPFSV